MAYFPNGSSGECFDRQCQRCRYGQQPCPIAFAQVNWNYKACNNKVATEILDSLVSNDGKCSMFALDPDWFEDKQMKMEI